MGQWSNVLYSSPLEGLYGMSRVWLNRTFYTLYDKHISSVVVGRSLLPPPPPTPLYICRKKGKEHNIEPFFKLDCMFRCFTIITCSDWVEWNEYCCMAIWFWLGFLSIRMAWGLSYVLNHYFYSKYGKK